MAKEFFLPAPLYLQVDCYNDENRKCGAACVQMVLHDIDPQRLFINNEQNLLFDRITIPPTAGGWHNPPQGMRRVLNQDKPAMRLPQRAKISKDIEANFYPATTAPTSPYEFVIYGDSSPVTNQNPGIPRAISTRDQIAQIELLSRQLIRTVAINGVAPIIAVREDNAHWIIVNGFQIEDDYQDANLRQRKKIKAILIRNPLGRYTYRNVECGSMPGLTLQITGHECNLNPHLQDVVPFATWVREYMFSDWAETFVEVCDWSTLVSDELLSRIHCLASRTRRRSWLSAICNWIARVFRAISRIFPERQITSEEAVNRAKRAIENFKLSQLNERITHQKPLTPLKVKRLDRIDGDYYLVPFGDEKKILALINISATGEFDGATVLPINYPREFDIKNVRQIEGHTTAIKKEDYQDTVKFYDDIRRRNEHHIAPFDQHPDFMKLTAGQDSSLRGRTIRLPGGSGPLEITSVIRDEKIPYVWRPCPESFSASRPFHNLKITVKGLPDPISYYLLVDDYCLPVDGDGNILLPSPNYLELLAECIKQKAGPMVDEVLVDISRSGTTAMVMYKSNQTQHIEVELGEMRKIICKCLQDHPFATLISFRIKAFATNAFLTRKRGGGDDGPLVSDPPSGGGNGYLIVDCP